MRGILNTLKQIPEHIYFLLLIVITLPAVIWSYVLIVFNDDIHIFFGVAKIVDYFGSFPANVDAAWETRPIGNRLIFYGLYKLFEPFSSSELLFQVTTKLTVALFALSVCAFFAYTIHKRSSRRYEGYFVFLITALSLFTVHTMCIMQTEFFAVILSLLAIAMMMYDNHYVNLLSGVVLVYIFLLKGITIVMIPVIFAAMWLLTPEEERWRFYSAAVGSIIAAVLIIPVLVVGLKYFVYDFINMFPVQQANETNFVSQTVSIIAHSLGVIWFIPIIAIGVITGIFVFYDYLKNKDYAYALVFLGMWLPLIVVEYVQVGFWVYHYLGFIIPAIVSIYLFVKKFYDSNPVPFGTIITLAIIFIFVVSCSIWSTNYNGMWDQLNNDSLAINKQYHLDTQPSVLYLDQGNSVYFLKAPSYCRYIAPLSIQLSDETRNLTGTRSYKETMNCIMNYSGEFVVMNRAWFGNHESIDKKLASEYTIVSNKSWLIYQRN